MNSENTKIEGGYVLQPRKIDSSGIFHCAPVVRELWMYLIRKVSHKDNGRFKRGQGLFVFSDIQNDLMWYVGYRQKRYSKTQLTKSLRRLREDSMIATAKTTRGLIITILNYDYYQTPSNYEGNGEDSTKETRRQRTDYTINKNVKNERIYKEHSSSDDEVSIQNEVTEQQDGVDFLITKKKRKLNGKRFQTFCKFWDAFGYKVGKREAADAWYDIPSLTETLVSQIVTAAKKEATNRNDIIACGKIPKMAQGWITGRRWEDETNTNQQQHKTLKEFDFENPYHEE